MSVNIAKEVAVLGRMTVKDLRAKHIEVFGEATRSGNKDWLRKRIAWRMQANAHGDLSERARRRADELANDADLRLRRPTDRSKRTRQDFPLRQKIVCPRGARTGSARPGRAFLAASADSTRRSWPSSAAARGCRSCRSI